MIKKESFEKFEKELLRKEKVNIKKIFQIMDALYKEAVALSIFPPQRPS